MVMSGDNGFLVPPKSAGALARTMRLLIEDAPRRKQMGERSRRVAEERFSLDRLGEETEKVYRAAMEKKRETD
jgi:glycosyltransferase involved in cell wall biosynthesis